MKTYPNAWTQKVNQGATNFATLWLVQKRDGGTVALTDYARSISWGGYTFEARPGYERSALRYEKGLKPHTIEVDAGFLGGYIDAEELERGDYDRAIITLWMVDYTNPADGTAVLIKGSIGKVEIRDNSYAIEVVAITNAYGTKIMEVYSPLCRADLGDERCRATVPEETVSVDSEQSDLAIQMAGGTANGNAFYDDGVAEITSGAFAGRRAEIKSFDPDTNLLRLWVPFGAAVYSGDTIKLRAGCQKTLSDCKNKFGNLLNFRGEPFIPGVTKVMRFPDAK